MRWTEWELTYVYLWDKYCQSGLWISERAVPFPRDPDNSTFEFLKPREVWRITGTAMHRMSRLVVSKGTEGTCQRVLGLRAQGQEWYGGCRGPKGKENDLMQDAIDKWWDEIWECDRMEMLPTEVNGSYLCPYESSWGRNDFISTGGIASCASLILVISGPVTLVTDGFLINM